MSWTIIVASAQPDQLDELVSGAQEIAAQISSPGGISVVVSATSVEDVRKRRRYAGCRKQLLIVAASLPEHQSSPDLQGAPGLELIKSIGRELEPPACILVSERVEDYLAVQGFERCEWLAVNCCTNYVEQCLLLARKLGIISAQASLPKSRQSSRDVAAGALPEISHAPSIADIPVSDVTLAGTTDEPPAGVLRQADGIADPYALIEVKLPSEARLATVKLEIHEPESIQKSESQPLNLSQSDVDDLVKASQALKDRLSKALQDPCKWRRYRERWQADYRALGERVGNLLWPTVFNRLYGIGRGKEGREVRLRFSLEQPCFDALWEAIFDALGQRFLMLDHTVTRRAHLRDMLGTFANTAAGPHGLASRIGARDGVLNVLVIQSNVPDGSAPDGPDDSLWRQHWESLKADLPNLPHLEEEVKVIRALQRGRTGANTGGNAWGRKVKVDVLPLRTPRRSWSLAEVVEQTLKDPSRDYDIVHFAGHALFATNRNSDGRGYLIFSGHPRPRAIPIATVASWLQKSGVQLVYLSCCRSSAARAALELARNEVPMTIGFHWDLDDRKAVDFAKNFYDELLKTDLKVCSAMRQARRKLYEQHDNADPIWASPVLVAQPMDWIQVERGLRPASHNQRLQPFVRIGPAPRKVAA
jgi:hypothetical protein